MGWKTGRRRRRRQWDIAHSTDLRSISTSPAVFVHSSAHLGLATMATLELNDHNCKVGQFSEVVKSTRLVVVVIPGSSPPKMVFHSLLVRVSSSEPYLQGSRISAPLRSPSPRRPTTEMTRFTWRKMMNLARLSGDEQYFIRLIRDRNYF